ncbi:tumor protein p63-regulated gene 1-like protein isoform X2 [Anthonomus grandis grandis]|uniref:tumor protein p63-regulated gene 1-like protein isoform X2 n=1 Tax=Anthonomus grandis grandis TaxID=2921223 RepID=UPI0021668F92|nr:tumor protein p63-regulated gene 1-like protein isoform X2 [Anthonomus grandis grandis]
MSLEEDIHEEFRGGSLRFNKSGEQQPVPSSSGLRESYRENKGGISKTDSTASNSSCYWSGLPLPLSSLSTKITETLWSAKPKDPSPVLEKQAPIHHQPPTPPPRIPEQDANSFFTYRDGVAERAALECAAEFLDMEHEGPVIQYFLLTQINHWDTDKERLILLTPKILLVVKYDFIALKRLSYKKLPLEDIEAVIIGDLIYPNGSLIPDRNMKGIRILFAKGKPIKFSSKWNPFTVDLPIWTFTYHPLYFHKDCSDENQRRIYDLDNFNDYFCKTIMELGKNYESRILHSNVLLENYVGFGAIIHNRNDLGFFKVRGKFSF